MAAKKASNGHKTEPKPDDKSKPQKRFDRAKKAVSLTLLAEANDALTEIVRYHRFGAATGVVCSEALIFFRDVIVSKATIDMLTPEALDAILKLKAKHRPNASALAVVSEAVELLAMTLDMQGNIKALDASGKLPPQITELLEKNHAAIASSAGPPQLSRRAGGAG